MSIQRALALAALIIASFPAASGTQLYTTKPLFEASAPALTFSSLNLTGVVCAPCSSITDPVTGTVFTTTGAFLSITNSTTIHISVGHQTVTVTSLGANLTGVVLAFGATSTGFGQDVWAYSSPDVLNPSFSPDEDFGARVGTGPISSLTFTSGNFALDLSGFEVGIASSDTSGVPETSTLLSMAGGLLWIGALRWRVYPRPSSR